MARSAGLRTAFLLLGFGLGVGAAPLCRAAALGPVTSSDGQDRWVNHRLSEPEETLARAAALYADALAVQGRDLTPLQTLARLRAVMSLDPGFIDVQLRVSNLLLQIGQIEEAVQLLRNARARNPGSVPILAALADAERLHGQETEARVLAWNVLSLDPTQLTPVRVLLELDREQGQLSDGVTKIGQVFEARQPSAPDTAWLNLARLYLEVARSDPHPVEREQLLLTLLPIYRAAVRQNPHVVETLTLLADTLRDLGQKKEARATLRLALALEPVNVDLLQRCAELEITLGQRAAALEHYGLAYGLNPALPILRERLAALDLEMERYVAAILLLEPAAADTPEDANLSMNLAIAYLGAGRRREAEARIEACFAAQPPTPLPFVNLAIFQLAKKKFAAAAATLARAQERFPGSAAIRFYQAVQQRQVKNYPAALESLQRVRALAVGPESVLLDPAYYIEVALTLHLARRDDEIEPLLREGIARFPDNADLLNELAYTWAEAGDRLEEALTLARQALRLDPDSGAILDTIGWIYARQNLPKQALPYLQQAVESTHNDPVVLQHWVQTQIRLGQRREALAHLRRAVRADPTQTELSELLRTTLASSPHVLRSASKK